MILTTKETAKIAQKLEPIFYKAGEIACEMQEKAEKFLKDDTGVIEHDIVTDADKAVQEFILQKALETDLKHCKIIAEEDTPSVKKFIGDSDIYLTIDPIDGTANYAKNKPDFALIVALRTNKEQLYTFYHYPTYKWTQIMKTDSYQEIGSPPKMKLPKDIEKSVLYSFGVPNIAKDDPVKEELKNRGLEIFRRKEKFPQTELGSTALFTAGYSAGYFAPNPLCVDGLVALHFAKVHNLPIYSKGPNGEFDYGLIERHHHPGYYIVLGNPK